MSIFNYFKVVSSLKGEKIEGGNSLPFGAAKCAALAVALGMAMALVLVACPAAAGGDGATYRYACANGTAVEGTTDTADQTKCGACHDGFRLTASEVCTVLCSISSGTYTLEPTADGGGGQLTFTMVSVPVGSGLNFFTGVNDDGDATVDTSYDIAETELTYAVYERVRDWALDSAQGYAIDPGRQGADGTPCGTSDSDEASRTAQHPVTCINWYDSVKFANALSEYCRLTPVYQNGAVVMRTGTTDPTVSATANGFRLPTSNEWELAARYRDGDTNSDGDIKDSGEYYPGNYASGATDPSTDTAATERVAWYGTNSRGGHTNPVRQLTANALGLYDMSGLVWEWTFDLAGASRVNRGGTWISAVGELLVGSVFTSPAAQRDTGHGVRLVR